MHDNVSINKDIALSCCADLGEETASFPSMIAQVVTRHYILSAGRGRGIRKQILSGGVRFGAQSTALCFGELGAIPSIQLTA